MRMWGNEFRVTVVCVDSYLDGILSGRLLNSSLDEAISFRGIMDFLRKMEDLLNDMNFPQPFSAVRSFREASLEKQGTGPPDIGSQRGEAATFGVKVLFRQNASWQGSVAWLESGQEESFRSTMELLLLMDSALSGRKEAS